jgi:hypothetical protein
LDESQTWNVAEAFDIPRAIGHGWEALKRQPIGLLLGAFLMSVTEGGGGGSGGNGQPADSQGLSEGLREASNALGGAEWAVIALIGGCVLCCGLAILLFRSWLEPGYLRLHRELVIGGASGVGPLFGGASAWTRMIAWNLLSGVIMLGTLVVAMLPGGALLGAGYASHESVPLMVAGGVLMAIIGVPVGIYVKLGLSFGAHAVALDDLGVMDALERSWALARGARLHLFLFFLVTGLFWAAGLLLCCVGVFATRAIRDVGVTEGYLIATRPEAAGDFALMQADAAG